MELLWLPLLFLVRLLIDRLVAGEKIPCRLQKFPVSFGETDTWRSRLVAERWGLSAVPKSGQWLRFFHLSGFVAVRALWNIRLKIK